LPSNNTCGLLIKHLYQPIAKKPLNQKVITKPPKVNQKYGLANQPLTRCDFKNYRKSEERDPVAFLGYGWFAKLATRVFPRYNEFAKTDKRICCCIHEPTFR